ncbi:hypothetical protein RAS2_33540 [Phycisphaerae bacterium RAS2]|nr:hypothetical protein RAS2_33540 [Phycisphaerae bacterium RAS2]
MSSTRKFSAATLVRWCVLATMPPVLLGAGCPGDSSSGLSSRRSRGEGTAIRLPHIAPAAAYDACLHSMKQWFRVAEASPVDGQVRSVTTEYEQRGGTGRIRDTALKFPNRLRRTATLYVQPWGEGSVVHCVVDVQRLDTADHRVFRDMERFDDYPTDTPIDREAGVTAAQDQVWTDLPRDVQLERDILEVVRSKATEGTPPVTKS